MPKSLDQLALDNMVQALQGAPLPTPDPRKQVPLPTPDPRTWIDRLPRIQNSLAEGDEAGLITPNQLYLLPLLRSTGFKI
jgi:hypothetical protein